MGYWWRIVAALVHVANLPQTIPEMFEKNIGHAIPLGARGKMNPKLSRLWASYGLGKIPWSQWSPGLNCYKVIMEQENDRMLVRWCSQWRSWENSSSSLFHSCSSRFTWWTNHGHHKNCTSSQRRKRFFSNGSSNFIVPIVPELGDRWIYWILWRSDELCWWNHTFWLSLVAIPSC